VVERKPRETTVDKMYSRRRISMLAVGGATLVAVRPGLAFGRQEDATPAAGGVGSLADLQGRVFSKGPNGEEPTAAEEVSLTEEELEQIRGMGATAAIVMHYGGNDWAVAQIAGLKDQFGKMGIEVIAETDAGFDPATQVSDIETTLARNPSIIVSIPTDPVATATAYRQAASRASSSSSWTTCRRASRPARSSSASSRPTTTATASPRP
jgi:ribose transport system substrate-binding protein